MIAIMYQSKDCKYCFCFAFYLQTILGFVFAFVIEGGIWGAIPLLMQLLMMLLRWPQKEVQHMIRHKNGVLIKEYLTLLPWISNEVFFDHDDFLDIKQKEGLFLGYVVVVAENNWFYFYERDLGVN